MSHLSRPRSSGPATRLIHLAAAMRRSWSDARFADRRVMEMRTRLSRHSG
jgi:hypothetical protein